VSRSYRISVNIYPILEEEAYWQEFSKNKVAKNQAGGGKHKQHGRQNRSGGGHKGKKRHHGGADDDSNTKKAKHIKFNDDGEVATEQPAAEVKSEQPPAEVKSEN
jgi:hypothetical protein